MGHDPRDVATDDGSPAPDRHRLSRRTLLGVAAAGTAAVALPLAACGSSSTAGNVSDGSSSNAKFRALDEKIQAAMKAYRIPGVAVGVVVDGQEYLRGYGVTNVDYPVPVDADTVFRVGSTTKTFTGTTIMRLVDQGKVDLDVPVRRYLPDFAVSDPTASAQVTVRQLLNHSPGWFGDDYQDFGPGDNALARFVASMTRLPQLTPVGSTFSYNNTALCVAGRLIEVLTGTTYESAVRSLVIDPLKLGHSRYFSDEIVGFNVAAPHDVVKDKAVVDNSFWAFPRSLNATGGLISSVRDQLTYAKFHLGDGRTGDGTRLLTQASLDEMRRQPGPGGTLVVELEGMGVAWMLRPSAQGVRIVQHGGTWAGQISGFMMVPSRGFAITLLTNSVTGSTLRDELFTDDWALRTFAGVSNLPAKAEQLSATDLAPFAGNYVIQHIDGAGNTSEVTIGFREDNGRLRGTSTSQGESSDVGLAFYKPDFGLDLDSSGQPVGTRADFLRDVNGNVAWFRTHGRLHRRM